MFVICKGWSFAPKETKQRANQKKYNTKKEAEQDIEKLKMDFPGRMFWVELESQTK